MKLSQTILVISATCSAVFLSGCFFASEAQFGTSVTTTSASTTKLPAPEFIAFDPPSPSNRITPLVQGTIASQNKVRLYLNTPCTGSYVEGNASEFADGIEMTMNANGINAIYAHTLDKEMNTSNCIYLGYYSHDNIPPVLNFLPAPMVTIDFQDLPPRYGITGTVNEMNNPTSIRLYDSADCTGQILGEDTNFAFSSASGIVTYMNYGHTRIYYIATDNAGNISPCTDSNKYYPDNFTIGDGYRPNINTTAQLGAHNIYVADQSDHKILIYNFDPGITGVTPPNLRFLGSQKFLSNFSVAPATSLELYRPEAIAIAGNNTAVTLLSEAAPASGLSNGDKLLTLANRLTTDGYLNYKTKINLNSLGFLNPKYLIMSPNSSHFYGYIISNDAIYRFLINATQDDFASSGTEEYFVSADLVSPSISNNGIYMIIGDNSGTTVPNIYIRIINADGTFNSLNKFTRPITGADGEKITSIVHGTGTNIFVTLHNATSNTTRVLDITYTGTGGFIIRSERSILNGSSASTSYDHSNSIYFSLTSIQTPNILQSIDFMPSPPGFSGSPMDSNIGFETAFIRQKTYGPSSFLFTVDQLDDHLRVFTYDTTTTGTGAGALNPEANSAFPGMTAGSINLITPMGIVPTH